MIGDQLRRLREARGLSREAAAQTVHLPELTLTRLELGRALLLPHEITSLLRLYQVDDSLRAAFLSLAERTGSMASWSAFREVVPSWFEMYLGLEQLATSIRTYQSTFVPGLFQTADYAREVIRCGTPMISDDEIDQRVQLRMARQQAVIGPNPPTIWAVIDEEAVRRQVGDRKIMRAQVRRLIELADIPGVTIHLMPFNVGGYAATAQPFTIFRLPHREIRTVVYLERHIGATYLDALDDVEAYKVLMTSIGADALRWPDTRAFLTSLAGSI